MTNFMEQWKAFRFDNKGPEEYSRMGNTDKSMINRDAYRQVMPENEKVIYEVSEDEIELISDLLGRVPGDVLSFDDVFDGKYRIMIPFKTTIDNEEGRNLKNLEDAFANAGVTPDFSTGTVKQAVYIPKTKETRTKVTRIGKWLNKLEYEYTKYRKAHIKFMDDADRWKSASSDVALAIGDQDEERRLKAIADESREVVRKAKDKLKKEFGTNATDYDINLIKGMIDFWNTKSEFYRNNPDYVAEKEYRYSIIVSRAPIDVLRMSDFEKIKSCHSPDSGFFKCAVAEARGNGLVAYVVKNEDWKKAEKEDGLDLQDDEIFYDQNRFEDGIVPLSRIRLRKFQFDNPFADEAKAFLFAPEQRVYGEQFPGFEKALLDWSIEEQPLVKKMNDEQEYPLFSSFIRYGGSYEDTKDGVLLTKLFPKQGNLSVRYPSRNVAHDMSDEESLSQTLTMLRAELRDTLSWFNEAMQDVSVSAHVEDQFPRPPKVNFTAVCEFIIPEIRISWDSFAKTVDEKNPTGALDREVRSALGMKSWDGSKEFAKIEDDIEERLQKELNLDIGFSVVEEHRGPSTTSSHGNLRIVIVPKNTNFERTMTGLENFLEVLMDNYSPARVQSIKLIVEQILLEHNLLKKGEFHKYVDELKKLANEAYENLSVSVNTNSNTIIVSSKDDAKINIDFSSWIPKGEDSPQRRLARLNSPENVKRLIQDTFSNNFFLKTASDEVTNTIRKSLKKQLNLPGGDTEQEIDDIIDFNPFNFRIEKELNWEKDIAKLKVYMTITPDVEDEEILVAKSFISWVDKNYYKFSKTIQIAFNKIMNEEFEADQDEEDRDPGDNKNVYENLSANGHDTLKEVELKIAKAKNMIQEIEPYQKEMRKKHPKWKKRLIGMGGNKYKAAPFKLKVSMKRSKSAPPGAGGV